ncbi:MAG TPA: BamA/TamA family outer membrane protein [Mucilaginibacter sp.]|nr:BamA/TamA family outer membrane protein [Mucilaginibacter sp.]
MKSTYNNPSAGKHTWVKNLLVLLFICSSCYGYGQVGAPADSLKADSLRLMKENKAKQTDDLNRQYDVGDLYNAIFRPHKKPDTLKKRSGITVIPNIAANPTIGSQIGIKAVAGKKLGKDPSTLLSVAATSTSITTKGIVYFYINHNAFTNGNKFNFQGSLVAARTVTPDFGLGIGRGHYDTEEDHILSNPERKGHVLHSYYFNLREKVYKQILKDFFVGAGLSFEVRRSIRDNADTSGMLTPFKVYNDRYGFPQDHYSSNGFLFNAEYTTRDNQNRAYKGMYADVGIRINQRWIGSTKSAVQITTDFRKYFSLSDTHPEHVIAIWNWGSYLLSGAIPYLELPGTSRDGSYRSGRGYTGQYFKSTQYNCSEIEYRFPILNNKFLSGVAFFNIQTANDEMGTRLFEVWQPGGGGGLRVLFNKATRTNLCLDYAWGKYGSRGFFLGLNEAF